MTNQITNIFVRNDAQKVHRWQWFEHRYEKFQDMFIFAKFPKRKILRTIQQKAMYFLTFLTKNIRGKELFRNRRLRQKSKILPNFREFFRPTENRALLLIRRAMLIA